VARRKLQIALAVAVLLSTTAGVAWYFLRSPGGPSATVVSFDATSGQELWRVQVALTAVYQITVADDTLVVDGTVYSSSECSAFTRQLVLERSTGAELARRDGNPPVYIDTTRRGDLVVVFTGGPEDRTYLNVGKFGTDTGWQIPVEPGGGRGGDLSDSVAVSNGTVYAFTRPDALTAFDAQTGAILWRTDIAYEFLAAGDGYAFVLSNGTVNALDSLGAIRWTAPLPGSWSELAEADGRVYAGTAGSLPYHCES
jgi:outer membrane protein assembly factor BamB